MFAKSPSFLFPATLAVALALTACRGGGPGGSSGDGPRPVTSTHARANVAAIDPRDGWADPAPLTAALGLAPVADPATRAAAIAALHRATATADIGSRALIDRVAPGDVEILGERGGAVYAQWKAGPAGTLDIEFDWRFAPNVDAQSRALMERAGKAWSRRLADELQPHTVPAGAEIAHGDEFTATLDGPVTADDILIFVIDKGPVTDMWSSAGPEHVEYTQTDLQPRTGTLLLNRDHHDSRRVMVHEIGHVLGIGSVQSYPSVARYFDGENHAFTGPETMRANGGRPVPYQWLDADRRPVAPNTPGAEVDYGHPAVCSSVMAYCSRGTVSDPAEIDFAMLDDIGYDILDEATASEPELHGYGAWAHYSAWGIGIERVLDPDTDRLRAAAHAFGTQPATPLADNRALSGTATWTGTLLGVDTLSASMPPVVGDASLEIELRSLAGSARFDNLASVRGGASVPFRSPSLEYAGSVEGNVFAGRQGRVRAGFFGPAHDEMAGIVNDRDVGLLGGFGGRR